MKDTNESNKNAIKIVLIGNSGVGKTCISQKYINENQEIDEEVSSTIGASYFQKFLEIDGKSISLDIWDTAGQERFRSLALNYINNSHAFIFIYDISDKSSFDNLQNWIKMAFDKNKNSIVNLLIGNKCDKENERKISQNEGEHLAKENKFYFLETSAKNDENVLNLFYYITYKLIGYYNENENEYVENENVELCSSTTEELPTMRVTESGCKC